MKKSCAIAILALLAFAQQSLRAEEPKTQSTLISEWDKFIAIAELTPIRLLSDPERLHDHWGVAYLTPKPGVDPPFQNDLDKIQQLTEPQLSIMKKKFMGMLQGGIENSGDCDLIFFSNKDDACNVTHYVGQTVGMPTNGPPHLTPFYFEKKPGLVVLSWHYVLNETLFVYLAILVPDEWKDDIAPAAKFLAARQDVFKNAFYGLKSTKQDDTLTQLASKNQIISAIAFKILVKMNPLDEHLPTALAASHGMQRAILTYTLVRSLDRTRGTTIPAFLDQLVANSTIDDQRAMALGAARSRLIHEVQYQPDEIEAGVVSKAIFAKLKEIHVNDDPFIKGIIAAAN